MKYILEELSCIGWLGIKEFRDRQKAIGAAKDRAIANGRIYRITYGYTVVFST